MCRVQGVGSVLLFSAQPDSTMEFSLSTPWQSCRIYGLDLPTSSTIAGMDEAAGWRHCTYFLLHQKGPLTSSKRFFSTIVAAA